MNKELKEKLMNNNCFIYAIVKDYTEIFNEMVKNKPFTEQKRKEFTSLINDMLWKLEHFNKMRNHIYEMNGVRSRIK